jgi:hypothetical protein
MKAAANVADRDHEHDLRALAERLRDALPRVPSGYKAGRAALVQALVELDDISRPAATNLLTELEEAGAIKYTTEGRGIGAAGVWTYPRTSSSRPRTPVRTARPRTAS